MHRNLVGIVAFAGAAALLGVPARAETVTGTVVFEGKGRVPKPVAMDADPMCAKKHKEPIMDEVLVLGANNAMANVLVSVSKGLPAGKTWPAPKEPTVMDQNGCQYKPHVLGVMVGQPFKILNSDGVLHNVHALPKVNAQFNKAMPASVKETIETFTKEEGAFTVKCDVHPWMQAYVRVFPHPYYDVTKSDGKFSIANLDPGTYTLEAWHEAWQKEGPLTAQVTVGKDTKPVAFVFKKAAK